MKVEEVLPSPESVSSGEYRLIRPLFIYSSREVLNEKPQVATFVDYYIHHVNDYIDQVGYFPAPATSLLEAQTTLQRALSSE